ncbi:MAG: ATP-binding protein [Bacteroidales bacterium]|nr:ATP-binding protein [Candidatus Colicola equi]
MYLKSLKYHRKYKNNEWEIKNGVDEMSLLQLYSINLIVGKNATGKSNTILVLDTLADLVSGLHNPNELVYDTAEYTAEFVEGNSKYEYHLAYRDGIVISETLDINEKRMIDRKKGEIYYESVGGMMSFKTDETVLAVAKRDSVQHSYLDPLHEWGLQLRCYQFGTSMGKSRLEKDEHSIKIVNIKDTDEVVATFLRGEALDKQFAQYVLKDMKNLNYSIKRIDTRVLKAPVIDGIGLAVEEDGLVDYTDQIEMSSGMFRALSLLIQMEYAILVDTPQCILIDDIGEGLDYDRSWKLIEMIIKKAKASKMQVIMTTNDRFVMNKVPIQYWQVIARDKRGIRFYNQENSPQVFKQFAYMGLNNFDFFASEFYKGLTIIN